jgi:hypothetical protein
MPGATIAAVWRPAYDDYFTEDALLDVDGTVAHGHAEIAALYSPPGATEAAATQQTRRGHMLLTNPVIDTGLPDRFDATFEPRGNPLAE